MLAHYPGELSESGLFVAVNASGAEAIRVVFRGDVPTWKFCEPLPAE